MLFFWSATQRPARSGRNPTSTRPEKATRQLNTFSAAAIWMAKVFRTTGRRAGAGSKNQPPKATWTPRLHFKKSVFESNSLVHALIEMKPIDSIPTGGVRVEETVFPTAVHHL